MPRLLRFLLACLLLSLTLTVGASLVTAAPPLSPNPQAAPVEYVTIMVDYKTGTTHKRILGTIFTERSTTPPYISRWRFVGSFNGTFLEASGLVLEQWITSNQVLVTCRAILAPPIYELFFTTWGRVTQINPFLLRFEFPHQPREDRLTTYEIAVDGVIHEPGQGSQPVYHISEVGGGTLYQVDKVGNASKLPGGKPTATQSWTERIPILRDLTPFLSR